MIALGVYLLWGVANAIGQTSASPATQPAPQQTSKPSPLSASAIRQLQAKAESGDALAQASLGKAYEDGNGVPQSDNKAFQWCAKPPNRETLNPRTKSEFFTVWVGELSPVRRKPLPGTARLRA